MRVPVCACAFLSMRVMVSGGSDRGGVWVGMGGGRGPGGIWG